jgi:hypothetical protein
MTPANGYSQPLIVTAETLFLDAKIYGAMKKIFGDGRLPILA